MVWTDEMRDKYKRKDTRARTTPQDKAQRHRYYLKHKEKTILRNWERQIAQLGCSPEMYMQMMDSQGGRCAICARTNAGKRRLAVDHDHATGAVRGLLCNSCNTALGAFGDNPEMLKRAMDYLCHTIK